MWAAHLVSGSQNFKDPVAQSCAAGSLVSLEAVGSKSGRWRWFCRWRGVVLAVVFALVVLVAIRTWCLDIYYVGSGSMEPAIEPEDRVLVHKWVNGHSVHRGQLVVFDGQGSFAPMRDDPPVVRAADTAGAWLGLRPHQDIFVKRVIGIPGDRVSCCAANGQLQVNGHTVHEPYLYPGDAPSEVEFDVVVPEGRLWLLGDHRSVSVDSRSLLGAPGGGLVRADRVIGEPIGIVWPMSRGKIGQL